MSRTFPRSLRRAATALGVACAGAAPSAAGTEASDSVVRIECALEGGAAKATGFVWPEPGYVVTALHAVAGCDEIVVFSEPVGRETLGAILRVDLDSDLALLALDDPLDIPAARFAETQPDVRADYLAWGYPLAAEEMIEIEIAFGGGRKAGVTTLGKAFASEELEQLFRGQPYPNRETQILRVTSTIQPGHSGAPIFDAEGNVVAIADGGLLGGWRTINWSIPAYIDLPGLLDSMDVAPATPSPQAILHSSTTPTAAPVELGPAEPLRSADGGSGFEGLILVRQISLAEVGEMVSFGDNEEARTRYQHLLDLVANAPEITIPPAFDIYEDHVSGVTIGFPSGMPFAWNDEIQGFVSASYTGKVVYAATVGVAGSFQEATGAPVMAFIETISEGTEWDLDNAAIYADELDEPNETALMMTEILGRDQTSGEEVLLDVNLYVSGPVYIATAVAGLGGQGSHSNADAALFAAYLFASDYLTDFAAN